MLCAVAASVMRDRKTVTFLDDYTQQVRESLYYVNHTMWYKKMVNHKSAKYCRK